MLTNLQLCHLKSFVKTDKGDIITLCDLPRSEVLGAGGACFDTIEDLEESCTAEERLQQNAPEVVCAQCLKLGIAIPLRRSIMGRLG